MRLCLLALSLLLPIPAAADADLRSGNRIESHLEGESKSYPLPLSSGEFLKLSAEQQGVDLGLRLYSPAGVKLIEIDSLLKIVGTEELFFVCEIPGTYRLEIFTANIRAAKGRYTIRIDELRRSMPGDQERVDAERRFAQAFTIHKEGTGESMRISLDQFQSLIPFWQESGNRQREGITLCHLGMLHLLLSDNQKALDSLNQALPLLREVSDKQAEADALYYRGWAHNNFGERQKAIDDYNSALHLFRTEGDLNGEAGALNNLGRVFDTVGKKIEALEFFEEAYELADRLDDRSGMGTILNNISLCRSDCLENIYRR